MANIQRRTTASGETRYQVCIRLKGFAPQTSTFDRLTDAKRWAAKIETEMREGRFFQANARPKHKVSDAIDRYQREILPNKSSSTIRDQSQQLEWWRKEIGTLHLHDLTPAVIAGCKTKLAATPMPPRGKAVNIEPVYRSASTVTAYLRVMSHLCSTAEREWEWLERNPVMAVKKPKLNNARSRFLSDEERARLLQECKNFPDLYLAVVLALSTGARKNEIWDLRWHQIDLDRQSITLHLTKNKEIRVVPVVGEALAILRERQALRPRPNDHLFPGKVEGKSFDFRKQWEHCIAAAQLHNFRYHDLRHTAASYLAMSGATLPELAEILGHKTLQMVKRYAHFTPDHKKSVVERMVSAYL
ncbi:site-specific integrase [Chitinibacter fontanus]|uniref:Site-specific integrase n=1 Tax=Chitinibacter fontanus TaxID=1737446 RepID=A0A7D5VAX8_9NEIS|nr:site-specific integrase [Chitinibacter fontanus]QLI82637.1 site-specific integrase [Chitinibacter fontanus]